MSKREERKNEIRRRIITACLHLMGQKHFQHITMKDVCEEADVARKTLYSYFASKEEMLDEVSRSVMFDTSINSFTDALSNHSDTIDRLNDAFASVSAPTDEFSEHIDVFIQLIQNLTIHISVNSKYLAALHEAVFQFFTSCLQNSDTKNGLDARVIADLTTNTMIGIILSWVNNQDYPAIDRFNELKELICKIILVD